MKSTFLIPLPLAAPVPAIKAAAIGLLGHDVSYSLLADTAKAADSMPVQVETTPDTMALLKAGPLIVQTADEDGEPTAVEIRLEWVSDLDEGEGP